MFRRLIPSAVTPDQQKVWDEAGLVGHMLETGRPLDFDIILRAVQTYRDQDPDADSPGVPEVLRHLATLIDHGFAEYVRAEARAKVTRLERREGARLTRDEVWHYCECGCVVSYNNARPDLCPNCLRGLDWGNHEA